MIGQKKKLQDYPDKASAEMVVREPPAYRSAELIEDWMHSRSFTLKVRKFYDFSKFELQDLL